MGDTPARPTNVRFLVVAVTSLAAVFMYVDRACISVLSEDIGVELFGPDPAEYKPRMDVVMSAFFWSYALAQVPAGFAGSWFGLRKTLAIMLFTWSACTLACGLTTGFLSLFAARLAVGVSEAGAYPSAAALVKGWFPLAARSRANGFVALGGRTGLGLSYIITPWIAGYPAFGWRGVLILYGVLGMAWAAVFWAVVRDKAGLHPWANQAEADYAGASPSTPEPALSQAEADYSGPTPAGRAGPEWPVWSMLASPTMWLFGLVQFGSNMGWAFLITKFPGMLKDLFPAKDPVMSGVIASLPAWASCVGMFAGAFIGDWCVRRCGLRWGRRLPISVMLFLAGVAYLCCIPVTNAWVLAGVLALMAVCVDIGIPSIWAFAQDVGGKHSGAALGFGNMLGNLGAAVSPLLLGYVQRTYSYTAMFLLCAGCFLMASVAALFLDPTKPVLDD